MSKPRPPKAFVATDNLLDRSKIEGALRAAGWVATDDLADAHVVLVDLESREADSIISQADRRVIAYGPHVDDIAMARARALGADQVLARSRFFRDLGSLLPVIG